MSNLVVTAIAIALVAVTVVMAAFYGGRAYTQYQNQSHASRLLSEAEQVAGSLAMYKGSGETIYEPSGIPGCESGDDEICLDFLVEENYLMQLPLGTGSGWSILSNEIRTPIGSSDSAMEQCAAARERMGYSGDPYCCDDIRIPLRDPCCIIDDCCSEVNGWCGYGPGGE
ncbi:MAG: hypothetical protein U9N14_02445 [Pseudomonadota bacterium]|nr:hypothetical protein [Pseudomonadota bacterium]